MCVEGGGGCGGVGGVNADRRTEGQTEYTMDRPMEQGRKGARESRREGCVDGYTGCMNGRAHGCMDYSDCQIG